MNSIRSLLLLVLFIIILSSCKKEDEEEFSGIPDIKGTVTFDNGSYANNSRVFLNNSLKTTTSSDGSFIIKDVTQGNYELKIASDSTADGYSELIQDIVVENRDLLLEILRLPVPVKLESRDIKSNSLNLIWSKCAASDFREYQIYIYSTAGLDETTATRLRIKTNINDTSLSVKEGDFWWAGYTLSPGDTYYFRAFVMNSYGRMSGSNVLEVTTLLWDNADNFTKNYELLYETAFFAQDKLAGITWDGSYLWMYYDDPDNLNGFVKHDYNNNIPIDTIILNPSLANVHGITWDGDHLWASLGSTIKSIDIENKSYDKSYSTGGYCIDVASNNMGIVLLDSWNKVTCINPENGFITVEATSPLKKIGYSNEIGVAAREGEIWILNRCYDQICILDEEGTHVGVAEVDFLQGVPMYYCSYMPMCFMGDKLIIAPDSQVRIYSIKEKQD